MQPLVLIADDQPDVLQALRILLKTEGFRTQTACSPQEILQAIATGEPDLLLMDLNYSRDTTSGEEGLDILDRLRRFPAPPPVLVMTAWGSIELAVEAMRRGAQDFVLKPWDNSRLVKTVRDQLHGPREARQQAMRELALARQVQQEMLPHKSVALKTATLEASCRQAGAVGGDAFDFYQLAPGRAGFALADISGKGLASAMLMAHLIAALRTLMEQPGMPLERRIEELNRQFREATGPERFATLFVGEYVDDRRALRYINCGHVPPIMIRPDGQVTRLNSTCPVVGLLPKYAAEVAEVQLEPGSTVAVYSDGIPDAPTINGEFGDDGLARLLALRPFMTPDQITDKVAAETLAPQFDDMTLVLLRCIA